VNKFQKAKMLNDFERVVYKGLIGSSLYFRVFSENDHQVIFRIQSKRWMCDCEYSALSKKDCSHVIACKQWLRIKEASDKVKMEKLEKL
jgi:hypothetical protein